MSFWHFHSAFCLWLNIRNGKKKPKNRGKNGKKLPHIRCTIASVIQQQNDARDINLFVEKINRKVGGKKNENANGERKLPMNPRTLMLVKGEVFADADVLTAKHRRTLKKTTKS